MKMLKKVLLFSLIFANSSPMIVAIDDIVIADHEHESSIKKVLTSKKFWGIITGLGLAAGGGIGFWIWHNLKIKNEINTLKMGLLQLIEDNKTKINKYSFKIYRDNVAIVTGGKEHRKNGAYYQEYKIWLLPKNDTNSYSIDITFYLDLENLVAKDTKNPIALAIEQYYEKDFKAITSWCDPL